MCLMGYLAVSALILILGAVVYRRYYPVKGVQCVKNCKGIQDKLLCVDIRNYNERTEGENLNVMNIPYAYLKRFYSDIPDQHIHIIAQDKVELRLGIRFLRQKGYTVTSYYLATCPCKREVELVGCGA